MKIDYPHKLPTEEAKERIQALGDYLSRKYGLEISWNGEKQAVIRGKYLVVTIDGTVTFDDGMVVFEGKDPGFLWRGKAKDYLTGKLQKYLDPKLPVDQLPR